MRRLALAALTLLSVTACAEHVQTYSMPPSTYHSAQLFSDLAYAPSSTNQKLDLDIPEGTGNEPLVILVHGGDFGSGDKGLQEIDAAAQLRKAGYAVAKVNYRLSTEALFPAAIEDVKASVRYLRAHAALYHLDSQRFAIWGEGSGGYLAAAVGVTAGQTVFTGAKLGNTDVSGAVQAVITWAAPVDFLTLDDQVKKAKCDPLFATHGKADSAQSKWLGGALAQQQARAQQADLLRYVPATTSLPPFLVVHGDADCVVPPAQAQDLVAALKKHGGKATLTLVKGAGEPDKKFSKNQIKPGIEFLDRTLAGPTP